MRETYLSYQRFRYLKLALLLAVMAVAFYVAQGSVEPPAGDSLLGYTLGVVGALLIVLLQYLGVRKRSYRSRLGTVRGWLSAHVYLGLALFVIVSLHTGFQLGSNVHSLAYALMVVVIASGLFGVYAYARYPSLLSSNRAGTKQETLLAEIGELDQETLRRGADLGNDTRQTVLDSIAASSRKGKSWLRFFNSSGIPDDCVAILAEKAAANSAGDQAQQLHELLDLVARRARMVTRLQRDIHYRTIMGLWLDFHVIVSIGLITTVSIHVFSVFFFR